MTMGLFPWPLQPPLSSSKLIPAFPSLLQAPPSSSQGHLEAHPMSSEMKGVFFGGDSGRYKWRSSYKYDVLLICVICVQGGSFVFRVQGVDILVVSLLFNCRFMLSSFWILQNGFQCCRRNVYFCCRQTADISSENVPVATQIKFSSTLPQTHLIFFGGATGTDPMLFNMLLSFTVLSSACERLHWYARAVL